MAGRPSARSLISLAARSSSATVTGRCPTTRRALSPRPMPMSIRPPEMSFRVASALAVTVGSLVAGLVTHGPMRIREVAAAIRAKTGYTSCHSTWESHSQA